MIGGSAGHAHGNGAQGNTHVASSMPSLPSMTSHAAPNAHHQGGGSGSNGNSGNGSGSNGGLGQNTSTVDINALAAALQQAQKTMAAAAASVAGNSPQNYQSAVGNMDIQQLLNNVQNQQQTQNNLASQNNLTAQNSSGTQNSQQPDVQAILVEMQRLKNERDEYMKHLEEEKKKSKILVEDKKKEMEGFLGGRFFTVCLFFLQFASFLLGLDFSSNKKHPILFTRS
jgi:hypothetical protein